MSAADSFFDTNVLLYLLSGEFEKADRAEALIASGGIISVQVLNEFASIASRKLAMRIPEIQEVLSTIRAVCTVVPLDVATHELGLEVAERQRLSICDAMIVAAALKSECRVLYTEDFNDGQKIDRLTISNPFAVSGRRP